MTNKYRNLAKKKFPDFWGLKTLQDHFILEILTFYFAFCRNFANKKKVAWV
jgi:hypothetical protein